MTNYLMEYRSKNFGNGTFLIEDEIMDEELRNNYNLPEQDGQFGEPVYGVCGAVEYRLLGEIPDSIAWIFQ